MALTRSEAQSVSDQGFDKTLSVIVYEDSALFTKLKQSHKVTRKGGQFIMWPVRYKQLGSADAVDPDQAVGFERVKTRTSAQLGWKYYEADTMITWKERTENAGSRFQVVDLIKDKTKELMEDMYERFATDLYTSNPNGNGFSALTEIVDATTSYAGIAVADATNWASIETAETTLTLYSGTTPLAKMVSDATFGKKKPTLHMTTRNLQNKFESLMATNIRYEDTSMANAGFSNVTFRNAPVIGDDHCPASVWYGLNTDVMEFCFHSDWDFETTAWEDITKQGFPNALIKVCTWAGNLKSLERNSHFKYTAVDYTNN